VDAGFIDIVWNCRDPWALCFRKTLLGRNSMTVVERAEFVTRDKLLKLLSDAEIAKVSNAETATGLAEGSEYLDLEHLDKGVQRSHAGTKITIGNALPRSAVSPDTWGKLLAELST
jgi:hypothetical protein